MRATDFPALDGRPVTEAHARVCAERGHASHAVDSVDSGTCPRCGAVTESAFTSTAVALAEAVQSGEWDDLHKLATDVLRGDCGGPCPGVWGAHAHRSGWIRDRHGRWIADPSHTA